MKKSEVKLGMKVVPFKKTAPGWENLDSSRVWSEAKKMKQPFLYVTASSLSDESFFYKGKIIKKTELIFTLDVQKIGRGGDFFVASDFRPYVPTKKAAK